MFHVDDKDILRVGREEGGGGGGGGGMGFHGTLLILQEKYLWEGLASS